MEKKFVLGHQSSVNCSLLKIVSIYFALICVFSVTANSLLIFLLCSIKKSRKKNTFIITLSAINLIATLVETPFVAISNYNCR